MEGWEYQVIHINVEPPRAPGPSGADGSASGPQASGEGAGARPVFSQSFLKKEFPQFYAKAAPEGSGPQSQHPAQQLQTFLNGHGERGWELVGVFPVGNLSMMFFRRPKVIEARPASSTPEAATAVAEAAPASRLGHTEASLDSVLRRLTDLEQRLQEHGLDSSTTPTAQHPTGPGGDGACRPAPRAPLRTRSAESSEWVSPAQLARLEGETPVPTSRAAQAIGLRSAASLTNHGARYGYAPGLSKRGPNGLVAIYTGAGSADQGGKERRLWIVVPPQRLEG